MFGPVGWESLDATTMVLLIPVLVRDLLFVAVGVAGAAGAVLAALTRDDAYDAASRQSKWVWVAILAGSALACLFRLPFIAWIGAVAIGVYFFDVRPHLNNIIRGNYGW